MGVAGSAGLRGKALQALSRRQQVRGFRGGAAVRDPLPRGVGLSPGWEAETPHAVRQWPKTRNSLKAAGRLQSCTDHGHRSELTRRLYYMICIERDMFTRIERRVLGCSFSSRHPGKRRRGTHIHGISLSRSNSGGASFATTWTGLETVALSEARQTERESSTDLPRVHSGKREAQMSLLTTQTDSQAQGMNSRLPGRKDGWKR